MASSRGLVLALALAGVAGAQGGGEARGFEAVLWRHGGPALDAAFAKALRDAGVTAVSVDADEDPARAAEFGLRFYLDHAAGKGILHLREADFRRCLETYEKTRSRAGLVRPRPLAAKATRDELRRLLRARVGRAARQAPLMVSLDDEISVTRFASPLDFCFAPSSRAAFAAWLAARYTKIDALNLAWGTRFARFEDAVAPTTDEVRARELSGAWPRRLTDWNDHRAFMDAQLAEVVGQLCALSRELAPEVPVGFEGGQAPSAFGGFDWARLLAVVDYVEPYDIAGTRALVRSFARRGTRRYETVFPAKDPTLADLPVAKLYDALAHGLSGVIVWSSGRFFEGGDAGRQSAYGAKLARELPRVTGAAAARLAGARVYAGAIAILESQPSVRLHWMLDSAGDGKTWTRRFASYERAHSTAHAARLSWVRLVQDLGYAFHFIAPAALEERRFEKARGPRVVVLPSALALSDAAVAGLRAFAAKGGLVLADETPARYDERLVLREVPALDDFFGVERARTARRWLREGRLGARAPRRESGLGLVETGLSPEGVTVASKTRGAWCQFERAVGKGRAVLLNLAVAEYARDRLEAKRVLRCRELRARVKRLLREREVFPVAAASVGKYPAILERILLGEGRRRVLVVRANCLESPALFNELCARGVQKMTLLLPVPARVKELFSGKLCGSGTRVEVSLDPLRGSFFELEAL